VCQGKFSTTLAVIDQLPARLIVWSQFGPLNAGVSVIPDRPWKNLVIQGARATFIEQAIRESLERNGNES
jgi:hypothetical protein